MRFLIYKGSRENFVKSSSKIKYFIVSVVNSVSKVDDFTIYFSLRNLKKHAKYLKIMSQDHLFDDCLFF